MADFASLALMGPERLRGTADRALELAIAYDAARRSYWRALLDFGERWPEITPTLQELLTERAGAAPREPEQVHALLRVADAGLVITSDLPGASVLRREVLSARNALVEANLGLVARIAGGKSGSFGGDASPDDLFQDGVIGLMRACEAFDPSRGIRFATYATWWIRKHVVDAAAVAGLLSVTQKGFAAVFALTRAVDDFLAAHGGGPCDDALQSILDVGSRGLASIRAAAAAIGPVLSADAPSSSHGERGDNVVDVIGVERSPFTASRPERPDEALERRQVEAVVVEVLQAAGEETRRLVGAVAGVSSWLRVRPALRADPARKAEIIGAVRHRLEVML